MAQERLVYQGRIAVDPRDPVGKAVVNGARVPVETVLEHLARNPDLEALLASYPRLTVDDVKAVLAYARDAVASQRDRSAGAKAPEAPTSAGAPLRSPRAFYEQVTERDGVRAILSRLAE